MARAFCMKHQGVGEGCTLNDFMTEPLHWWKVLSGIIREYYHAAALGLVFLVDY